MTQKKIAVLLSISIATVILSCNSTKKLDNKALDRVLTRPELKEKVGREWEKQNPCVNDTVTRLLPGEVITKSDTVEVPILSTDTFQITEAVIKWKERLITKTITRVDTLRLTIEDTRRLGIANDSLNYYKGLWIQQVVQTGEYKHQRNTALWWKWLLIAAVGLFGLYKLKQMFMPAIKLSKV